MTTEETVVTIEREGGERERRDLEPGATTEVVADGPVAVTIVAGADE